MRHQHSTVTVKIDVEKYTVGPVSPMSHLAVMHGEVGPEKHCPPYFSSWKLELVTYFQANPNLTLPAVLQCVCCIAYGLYSTFKPVIRRHPSRRPVVELFRESTPHTSHEFEAMLNTLNITGGQHQKF